MRKKLISLFVLALSLLMLLSANACYAFAEESEAPADSTAIITELKEICAKLPATDSVAEKDGKNILRARELSEKLSVIDRAQVGSDNLTKIGDCYTAYIPYILIDLVEDIKALPKKVKDSDKDKITDMYKRYSLLDADSQEALDPARVKQLKKAVKEVAPELLGETAGETDDKNTKKTETKETAGTTILGMAIWEFVCILILALVVAFNIVLVVLGLTKMKYYKA